VKSYLGTLHSSGSEMVEATVLLFDKEVHIGYRNSRGENITMKWPFLETDIYFDATRQSTRLRHSKETGIEVFINSKEPLEYIENLKTEQSKPWHQKDKAKEWGKNFAIFLGVIGVLILLYFLLVPWMSEKLATRVSIKTEEQFGDAVYSALSPQSQENPKAGMAVNDFFSSMNIATAYDIRISVIEGEAVNAFALPGGRIVIYTGLLSKMRSYPELAALLSHEFTHVNNRHTTKSIFRKLGSRIFLGMLFGRIGSVTSVMVDQADNLKSLKYSRRLEKEADIEGLAILQERKIDPNGFVNLFTHLKQSVPAGSMPEFLASHPDIDRRISYVREASANSPVAENEQLKSIFEKIKQTIQP
jgi:Zn-dependent protease with chaperone function